MISFNYVTIRSIHISTRATCYPWKGKFTYGLYVVQLPHVSPVPLVITDQTARRGLYTKLILGMRVGCLQNKTCRSTERGLTVSRRSYHYVTPVRLKWSVVDCISDHKGRPLAEGVSEHRFEENIWGLREKLAEEICLMRNFVKLLNIPYIKYCFGDQIKTYEMAETYKMHGGKSDIHTQVRLENLNGRD
jgi:hypothetical protein